jgi:hypothetical protein
MSTEAFPGYSGRRRSVRFAVRFVLTVCLERGHPREETCTLCLSAHGVLVALATTVTIGQSVIIQNPENWADRYGRVARVGRCYAGRSEVGIEFTEPAPDFWLIDTRSEHAFK